MNRYVKSILISFGIFLAMLCAAIFMVIQYEKNFRAAKIFNIQGKQLERTCFFAMKYNDFDALILGSSMSTNFRCSEFDKLFGCHSLKMALSGCHMTTAMHFADFGVSLKKPKYVLLDLTAPHFLPPKKSLPRYRLNDSFTLKDLPEMVSFDAIMNAFHFYTSKENKAVSRDAFGIWESEPDAQHAIQDYAKYASTHTTRQNVYYIYSSKNTELTVNLFRQNVLPVISRYPDTTFIFYFAPYSLLVYEGKNCDDLIQYKQTVMNLLLACPNVHLYDFQNATEVTNTLENYKDYSHYSCNINSWILQQISQGRWRVTRENMEQTLADFRKTVETHDYQADRRKLNSVLQKMPRKK